MSQMAQVQVQDPNGTWRTVSSVHYSTFDQTRVRHEMESVQRRFGAFRIRAVDQRTHQLVDIL